MAPDSQAIFMGLFIRQASISSGMMKKILIRASPHLQPLADGLSLAHGRSDSTGDHGGQIAGALLALGKPRCHHGSPIPSTTLKLLKNI